MRVLSPWIVLPVVAAAALLSPERAAACSCTPDPFVETDPVEGERDVPLNQAISLDGVFRQDSVQLEDEAGNPVEFALNAGRWPGCEGTSAELIPRAPLAPNTRYVVRVEPLYPNALGPSESNLLTFTTGTKLLPETTPEPPRAIASVVFDGPPALCGPGHRVYACLGIEDAKDVELIIRRGDEILLRTTTLVQDDGMYAIEGVPDCVELRRRSPTGKRSTPHAICGDALKAQKWGSGESQLSFPQCKSGVIGSSKPPAAGSRSEAGSRAEAGSRSEAAGSRSDPTDPPPSDEDDSVHRTYGCGGCASGGDELAGSGLFALLAIALLLRRRG